METPLLVIVFYFLATTSMIWPYVFIRAFLRAQKKIRDGEDYSKDESLAYWSLLFMIMLPLVIALLKN